MIINICLRFSKNYPVNKDLQKKLPKSGESSKIPLLGDSRFKIS